MDDFLNEVDEQFERICAASADLTQINQEQRPLKEGQIQVKGTFEAFVSRVSDGNNMVTVAESKPPSKVVMLETRDKKKKYPAALPFFFRFDSLSPEIPGYAEPRTDNRVGWRLLADVKYFDEGSDFLKERREAAWADLTNEELEVVREFITSTGMLVTQKWVNLGPGDQIKMKLRDSKDNLFRRENPDQPGVPLVQPSTPLVLSNVKAVIWVTATEIVETLPLPDGSAPDAKAPTRKVLRLNAYNTYECKGSASVSADYDKNMCLSERKHGSKDPAKHQLVPIEQYQSGARMPARSAYFYVNRAYTTLWVPGGDPQLEGITMRRNPCTNSDFKSEFNNEWNGKCDMSLNLFQWRGRPDIQERYIVKLACSRKDSDRIWTAYGITSLEAYEAIVSANPELPVHVEAGIWDSSSKGHPGNDPKTIRSTEDVATVRGYYVYGITELVPDYLRYFQGGRGLKLSLDYVLREFANWNNTNAAGRRNIKFDNQAENIRRNPVNVFGDKGVVTALGNGQLKDPTNLGSEPLYLAFAGDATALFTGRHQFYVLISHHMTEDEARTWAGPGAPDADAYLDNLRKSSEAAKRPFYYWIFAVLKDAKKAKPRPRPEPMPVAAAAPQVAAADAPISPGKRARPEDEIAAHINSLAAPASPAKQVHVSDEEEDEEEEKESNN